MGQTILVVDDEARIVKLVRDYLERAGFDVLAASDGETALTLARVERPDLIVLDLMLPGVDGLDVCRRLRHESGVPIIMLTARVEEADRIVGLSWAPTTISPSRSAPESWWPASAPRCAAPVVR